MEIQCPCTLNELYWFVRNVNVGELTEKQFDATGQYLDEIKTQCDPFNINENNVATLFCLVNKASVNTEKNIDDFIWLTLIMMSIKMEENKKMEIDFEKLTFRMKDE